MENCNQNPSGQDETGRRRGGNRDLTWEGVPLTERDRYVGRPRFVCVGGGGVSKWGEGGSDPSFPSSLRIFYIELGEP